VPGEADWSYHATAVVSEAVGMTMEYLNCSSLAALDALTAQSEQTGESLVAVAVDVIDRRYRPGRR
jgi:hypothetical protein